MHGLRRFAQVFSIALFALVCVVNSQGQVTTGSVRGAITDPNGAAVTNAKITITKRSTRTSSTTQTSGSGQFEFNNLQVGEDYDVTIEAAGFKILTLSDVTVTLSPIAPIVSSAERSVIWFKRTFTSESVRILKPAASIVTS